MMKPSKHRSGSSVNRAPSDSEGHHWLRYGFGLLLVADLIWLVCLWSPKFEVFITSIILRIYLVIDFRYWSPMHYAAALFFALVIFVLGRTVYRIRTTMHDNENRSISMRRHMN